MWDTVHQDTGPFSPASVFPWLIPDQCMHRSYNVCMYVYPVCLSCLRPNFAQSRTTVEPALAVTRSKMVTFRLQAAWEVPKSLPPSTVH